MSSHAYLHQTNILYSRISSRYNADIESEPQATQAPIRSFQNFIAPAAQHLRTLFLPYKGHKRTFILKQYREQQARLQSFTKKLIATIQRVL